MLSHLAAHSPRPDAGPATWHGGTLPQWLTVLAAVIAFIWTVFIYRRSVADKRKEQPRLVYAVPKYGPAQRHAAGTRVEQTAGEVLVEKNLATIEEGPYGGDVLSVSIDVATLWVEVVNGSAEMISDVSVMLFGATGTELRYSQARVADYMVPGDEKLVNVAFELPEGWSEVRIRPAVFFTDGVGHMWHHRAGDQLVATIEIPGNKERLSSSWRRARYLSGRLVDQFRW